MKPFILGAIFARGGSKGIPRKNIYSLGHKPLLAYAIETGLSVALIDKLIVSTDDQEIAAVARQYGAEVPFIRPVELAGDHSPEILSWQHAVKEYEAQTGTTVDILVAIPTTSPLREPGDVQRCLLKLIETDADVVLTVTESHRNPYFNMVKIDHDDNVRLVIETGQVIANRQDVSEVFDITTVAYAVRAPFLRQAQSLLEGKVKAVTVPRERALDIDTMLDLEMAEFFLNRKLTPTKNV